MAEHPILFGGPMVQAIRNGRKTQTRRVMKPQPTETWDPRERCMVCRWQPKKGYDLNRDHLNESLLSKLCPYGVPDDTLVPRTTWAAEPLYDGIKPTLLPNSARIWSYWDSDDPPEWIGKRRPGRFLPKRFWHLLPRLANKDVRVQRVQEISHEDVLREGLRNNGEGWGPEGRLGSIPGFRDLWDSINAKRGYGWNANPWVWALTFEIAR